MSCSLDPPQLESSWLRLLPNPLWRWAVVLLSSVAILGRSRNTQASDLYLNKIKPILTEKCISCHGALRSEAGLRLDAIQFIRTGSDSGSVVELTSSNTSKLLDRVTSNDLNHRMPPEDAGTALSDTQVRSISQWLEQKLPGPDREAFVESSKEHWAYQPINRPATVLGLPTTKLSTTDGESQNPIDQLVLRAQRLRNTHPLASASDTDWLRRITFDVSGLPPTFDEINRFVKDTSPDKRGLEIDRLLSRPSYGERWGRHWMDVWRYSDWDGYKNELRSSQRHIWHWRDWIIESLNANKPYDQMILEMLAADELARENTDSLRATGFLARNYHKSNRNIWLDATVEHTAKAFLGMTLNCAKCHDHKYDPIPQTAYYQFRALFEPHRIRTEQLVGIPDIEKDGIPRAYDDDLNATTYLYVRGNDKNPLKDSPIEPSVLDFFQLPFEVVPIDLPLETYYPELSPIVRENTMAAKLKSEKNAIAKLQTKLELAEKASDRDDSIDDPNNQQQQIMDIELASSEVQLAMADRASTIARYAAEELKYSLPKTIASDVSDSNEAQWISLAQKAATAEFSYIRLKGSHDVFVQQRALNAALTSKEQDQDKAKRDSAIKSAKEALKKVQEKRDKLPFECDLQSTTYMPVGKELPHQSTGRRLALAKWIIHPENPLTARVAINHIWLRHFGTPLVDSTFDFGMTAPKPELLDVLNWLAAELISSDWDMKHIHRLILTSETYAAASDDGNRALYQANEEVDPENKTYWHANIRRLDAEEIRDSLLVVSNALDNKCSGPDIDFAAGETVMRRSLYFRHAYEKQMPMLVLFDAASPSECYRRKPSLVPQQALVLANSSLARRLAKQLSDNCFRETSRNEMPDHEHTTCFVDRLFRTAIGRPPSSEELMTCIAFLASQAKLMSEPGGLTRFSDDSETTNSVDDPNERARHSLAVVLFNHHDFVSIR